MNRQFKIMILLVITSISHPAAAAGINFSADTDKSKISSTYTYTDYKTGQTLDLTQTEAKQKHMEELSTEPPLQLLDRLLQIGTEDNSLANDEYIATGMAFLNSMFRDRQARTTEYADKFTSALLDNT